MTMKKSNIGLAVLASVFLSAWLGNIYYHKCNFVKNQWQLLKSEEFNSVKDSIRVVSVIDSSNWLKGRVDVLKGQKWDIQVSQVDLAVFYRSMLIVNDTLFVTNSFARESRRINGVMLKLSLPRVSELYYNRRLVKQLD